jgi:hypothetical protein
MLNDFDREAQERIDDKYLYHAQKLSEAITHWGWTIGQFIKRMDEAMTIIEEEQGPWKTITEYADRKEEAYHTAMGWMIKDEHTIPYTGEEND